MVSRESRGVIRLQLDHGLDVVVGSIGSEVRYKLSTHSISNNGFFLDFQQPGRFPFTSSSIMEIWLRLDEETEVFFNGKLTRVVYPGDDLSKESGPGIAVRIVQIGAEAEQVLLKFITDKLEAGIDSKSA